MSTAGMRGSLKDCFNDVMLRPVFNAAASLDPRKIIQALWKAEQGVPGATYHPFAPLTNGRLRKLYMRINGRRSTLLKDRPFFKVGWTAKPA